MDYIDHDIEAVAAHVPYTTDGTTYAAAPAPPAAAPAAARTIVDGPPPALGRPGHPMV
jgi:hypothetical protein